MAPSTKKKRKFHSYAGRDCEVSKETRDGWLNDHFDFQPSKDVFLYARSGDSLVVGFYNKDLGEWEVWDCQIRREYREKVK